MVGYKYVISFYINFISSTIYFFVDIRKIIILYIKNSIKISDYILGLHNGRYRSKSEFEYRCTTSISPLRSFHEAQFMKQLA